VGEQFGTIFNEEPVKLTLPYDVPANQFMNLEGKKISGSRNWAVWGREFLSRYDPDALRYYLTINMPESKDSDWDWKEFVARNNNELVATWGNLANRVLSFCYRNWDGHVPEVGALREQDVALLAAVEDGFNTVGRELEAVHLRGALQEALRLAALVNQYLDQTAPWSAIKKDKEQASLSIYTALKAIDSLKLMFAPFLPFTSQRLHEFFGYTDKLFGEQYVESIHDSLGEHTGLRYRPTAANADRWVPSSLRPGQALTQPAPLFKKLDEIVAKEERDRLGGKE
jgi:methionyl-tRNA synthetase